MGRGRKGHEVLRAVCIGAAVGHNEESECQPKIKTMPAGRAHSPLLVNLRSGTFETLILEHPSVNTRSASAVSLRVVASLHHETINNAVDRAALVALQTIRTLVSNAEGAEAAVSLDDGCECGAYFSAVFGTLMVSWLLAQKLEGTHTSAKSSNCCQLIGQTRKLTTTRPRGLSPTVRSKKVRGFGMMDGAETSGRVHEIGSCSWPSSRGLIVLAEAEFWLCVGPPFR